MPHPILKKPRGPSRTGERPTARFVSPQHSSPETEKETELDLPVESNSHVVVQPPTPDAENMKVDRKLPVSAGGKKKSGVVASSAKKRPAFPRRQSSQSSAESSHHAGSSQRAPPTTSAQKRVPSKPPVSSKFQENFSPATRTPPNAQKREVASKESDAKRNSKPKPSIQRGESSKSQQADTGPSRQRLRPTENSQDAPQPLTGEELKELELQKALLNMAKNSRTAKAGPSGQGLRPIRSSEEEGSEDLTVEELKELEVQKALLKQANDSMRKPSRAPSQTQSNSESRDRVRFQHPPKAKSGKEHDNEHPGGVKKLPLDTKGTTSIASSSIVATGNLDIGASEEDKDEATSIPSCSASKGKCQNKDPDDMPAAGGFSKQPVPPPTVDLVSTGPLSRSKSLLTVSFEEQLPEPANGFSKQPVPPPSVDPISTGPLSRSKSQLTLMLEKDQARKSGSSSANGKKR